MVENSTCNLKPELFHDLLVGLKTRSCATPSVHGVRFFPRPRLGKDVLLTTEFCLMLGRRR